MTRYETYGRGWYARNRDRVIAQRKARYAEKKEEILANARLRYRGRYRDSKLAKTYGISKVEAQKWLAITSCQICGASDRKLTLDHDHTSGRVRGRLCEGCNFGIGQFKDNPETLVKAAEYLRSKGKQTW